MIIDSDGTNCHTVNFNIGATTTTRNWDIFVTQYTCSQEDVAGPPGCLQYHTSITGLVKNFGYPSSNSATVTDGSTTHLQNQNYQICIRRASGKDCNLSYVNQPSIQGAQANSYTLNFRAIFGRVPKRNIGISKRSPRF